ncbi:MAG: hypothetical protein CMB45_05480 [Euryarchaeota archaeon]|nr:hypothetical protein [Euryarchaeota archaeon]MBK38425.1 hypothetical protein [Euryarchaeota archaeon]|tara:strand:- start:25125 stop:25733 length:609 start_codon:yes stop_codon:yes gene_type:complete
MRGDQFFSMGYGSMDDEDDEEEMDLSGFMGGAPSLERPKVTPRARSRSSNIGSGPESTAGPSPIPNPQPIGTTGNVGYNYNVPAAGEGTILSALHPLQADDEALLGSRVNVIMKGTGMAGIVLTGMYMLGKRGSGGAGLAAKTIMGASIISYTWPVVGWDRGILAGINSNTGRRLTSTALHAAQIAYLAKMRSDIKNRGLGA